MRSRLAAALAFVIAVSAPAYAQSGNVTEEDVARAAAARKAASLQAGDAARAYEEANDEAEELEHNLTRLLQALTDRERDLALSRADAREVAREMFINNGAGHLSLFDVDSITQLRLGEGYLQRASWDGQATIARLEAVKQSYLTQQEIIDEALDRQLALTAELDVMAADLLAALEAADAEYRAVANRWAEQEAARLEAERKAREAEERRRWLATSTTTTVPPSTTVGAGPTATSEPPEGATTTTGAPPPTTTLAPPPAIDGKTCPVNGAVAFTDTWGAPRSGGRSHQGVDMIAVRGTPLVALEAATVARIGNSGLGGKTVWLRAPSGDTYYYAHLDGWAAGLSTGQRLATGELLGYVGNTGNAIYTVPHLHFEYHPGGGAAINPYPLVADLCL